MLASRLAATAALALISASPAPSAPAAYVVQVYSYGFAPRPIYLRAGQPVTLTFVNQSGSSHDFVAPGFFQHAKILGGSMPMQMSMIDLRPRETKSITLIPVRGTYQAHCSHFFHKQLGMSDTIVVN
jgi:plastocyanin